MRIRLTKAIKGPRILTSKGSAALSFEPGDYEVGEEIPKDIALDAISRGDAIRLKKPEERETKVA